MERLPGVPALRRLAFNVARRPSYTPCTLELRLFSRETVLTLTPMVLAMKLSEHFFCSNTLIVYLCSEVNSLYICNTKLINLREGDECSPPFLHCLSLPPGSSGASRPQPQGKPPWCFSWCQTPLRFRTSVWKEPCFCLYSRLNRVRERRKEINACNAFDLIYRINIITFRSIS